MLVPETVRGNTRGTSHHQITHAKPPEQSLKHVIIGYNNRWPAYSVFKIANTGAGPLAENFPA